MTLTVVDAFTDRPFAGNPAAVCLLDAPADAAWMQAFAAEMNLSETAFVVPEGDASARSQFGLRWFTPATEERLCGHATLAAAHVLFETGRLVPDAVARFDTLSGLLTVRQAGAGSYAMDFPATPPTAAEAPAGTADAFGETVWTGRSLLDLFLVMPSEAAVRALDPDPAAVARLTAGARGIIATAQADAGSDVHVVSRFFAPDLGVTEDPVTGSAHCAVGPFWADRLGTTSLRCFQASRRGGYVGVEVRGDRVELTGRAVTVYQADVAVLARPWPET